MGALDGLTPACAGTSSTRLCKASAIGAHPRVRGDVADPHEGRDWCWFRDLPVNGLWLGDDLYFCRRVRALGFPIVAHTGAILQHRRRYWLDERQHEALRAAETRR